MAIALIKYGTYTNPGPLNCIHGDLSQVIFRLPSIGKISDKRTFTVRHVTWILLVWTVKVALRGFASSMKTQMNWVHCLKTAH